jgi:CBS domain containing-hemolysin-like protein
VNDGVPESLAGLGEFSLLGGFLLLSFLAAGAISSLVLLARMRRDGLLPNDASLPARSLLERLRNVLLALSIAFLLSSCAVVVLFAGPIGTIQRDHGRLVAVAAWPLLVLALLFGSVLAKALALSKPVGYARAAAPLVWLIHLLLWPLTKLLERSVARLTPTLWALELSPPFSGQEIRGILADEDAAALMEDDELDWARSIFELGDTEIREIMLPRIDMVGLDVDTDLNEAVRIAAEARYTRLPVWEGSQDRILGLLHAKDLLAAAVRGSGVSVRSLLRKVHFLPESKKIDEALREFRDGRVHLAVVVDEYGGTAGIVTLEDILEEIVGEIRDEFDQERELVHYVDSHRAIIDPRIDLDDLNALLGLNLPTDEVDTLGGLLYQLCGRVPERGDDVTYGDLNFTVDRVERQRIRQVTLTAPQALASAPGAKLQEGTSG